MWGLFQEKGISFLLAYLVGGGLEGRCEEYPEALRGAVALVGVPLPEEEQVVGHLLRPAVAGGGRAEGEVAAWKTEVIFW